MLKTYRTVTVMVEKGYEDYFSLVDYCSMVARNNFVAVESTKTMMIVKVQISFTKLFQVCNYLRNNYKLLGLTF